jgi:thioredoxin 1
MIDVHPLELTDANFDSEVLRSEQPVLVDFWADWCGPCRQIAPAVEAIAQEHAETLKVGKMDVDTHIHTPSHYGVQSIPTLLLFKGGQPVERILGNMPKERIMAQLRRHLS